MRNIDINIVEVLSVGSSQMTASRVFELRQINAEPQLSAEVKQILVVGSVIGINKVCGEQINSHTPVVLIGGQIFKLNSLNPNHQFNFLGFSKTSGNVGDNIGVEDKEIELQGWNLTPNTRYLAGPNGALQITNSSGFTQVIGYAQTSNKLLIHKGYTPINKV